MFKLLLFLAFVLLLNAPSPVDSKKVGNHLKDVGKRFMNSVRTGIISARQQRARDIEENPYIAMTDEQRNASRWESGRFLWEQMIRVSSSEDPEFKPAIDWIFQAMNDNMTAEICGDPKSYNAYQWIKHMRQQAAQYKKVDPDTPPRYIVKNTVPSVLQVIMIVDLKDKNDVKAEMHYGLTLQSEYNFAKNKKDFSIHFVKMGGTCMEHGEIKPLVNENEDPQRYLTDYPDGLHLLNIFAPNRLKYAQKTEQSDLDIHHLPRAWLEGIAFDAGITVPQEDHEQPVVYKRDEFLRWYEKFALMWHPAVGEENWLTRQEANYNEGVLVGRVSMKLQIGIENDSTVHEWQFKVTGVNDGPKFQLIKLDVLSPLTLKNIMNENFLVYRDLLGVSFTSYLRYADMWYPALDFLRQFERPEKPVNVTKCMGTTVAQSASKDWSKYFWNEDDVWNGTMVGYYLKKEQETAKEETSVELRMKLQTPKTSTDGPPTPESFYGSDWEFFMKWDKMDQFYYVDRVEMTCPRWLKPGQRVWKTFPWCPFKHCGVSAVVLAIPNSQW